ncbi:retrovirus-related pol polyprotein from transposon TNT 1-94 [Tanacetum coccineum]
MIFWPLRDYMIVANPTSGDYCAATREYNAHGTSRALTNMCSYEQNRCGIIAFFTKLSKKLNSALLNDYLVEVMPAYNATHHIKVIKIFNKLSLSHFDTRVLAGEWEMYAIRGSGNPTIIGPKTVIRLLLRHKDGWLWFHSVTARWQSKVMKGLSECKASKSNVRCIQVKDIVKEVADYLKTYSSAGMDISWFLVFLDVLEPYLLKTLEDGPFVPMSSLSTIENPLPKRQNQWSNAKSRLANQDKGLKSIIISCLPNDVMKYVIKCKTAKEMWNDLILAHEGSSVTRDTKIAALRLKFNAFKSLEGEKVMGTFTRLKCLLNDLENNGVTIPQAEFNATFDSDSDVEEDQRNSNKFMADLNAEYHERALLANQKIFYKIYGRDFPSKKTSTPSYSSLNNSFNKFKSYTPPINQTSSHNIGNYQKDYNGKYKGLKAKMVVLTQRIDDLTKGNSEKGKTDNEKSEKELIAESFDWDEESVSSEDEGTTRIRAFMAIVKDKPSVGKTNARSGKWVDITMKKVHRLLSMTDSDDRKHVLDYTHVDLIYVEDQRKNMVNKYNLLKQELSLHKSELITLNQLLSEQIPGNIVKALGGKGRRKENNLSKEVLFTKADVSTSESAPMITSGSEDDSDIQEPLSPLPKLTGADPSNASKSLISLAGLTANMADLTLNTASREIKKSSNKGSQTYNALPSTEQLLLTLMEEVKGIKNQILIPSDTSSSVSQACSSKTPKQKVWYGPCKHCGMRNHLFDYCYSKPKCSTCGLISHTTKEHTEQTAVRKSLNILKGQSTFKSIPVRTTRMSKTFGECKYYGSNKHHPDDCKFYPGCEICGSIAHEIADCPKNLRNSRKQRIAIKQSEPTEKYSKERGPKVVFRDDSLGDTKGYGSVNCNGITFTRVAYTQGTIFNQNDKVVLIAPRRKDVYIIDMSSFNKEINACFLTKAFPRVNWLWHKRLSHLNFKNINSLAKHNLVFGLPSLTFSKDKNCSACEKGKHHRASFKTKRSFSINKSLHILHMDLFRPRKSDAAGCIMSFIRKMKNLNEVRVKELRSNNGTEFRNHKLEEFCDEKGVMFTFTITRTTWESLMKRLMMDSSRVTLQQPRLSGCSASKDKKLKKQFMLLSVKTMKLSLKPTQKNSVTSKEPPEFTIAGDLPVDHEPDHAESADILESAEPQDNVLSESISDDQPALVISPSAKVILQNPVP